MNDDGAHIEQWKLQWKLSWKTALTFHSAQYFHSQKLTLQFLHVSSLKVMEGNTWGSNVLIVDN